MQVERTVARGVEHGRRQDLAVGDHHRRVEVQRLEGRHGLRIAHGGGRAHRQAQGLGERLHRRGPDLVPAPARRRRLGVDGGDLVSGGGQFGQGGHGEVRSAEEGDAHGRGLAVEAAGRNPLSDVAVCGERSQTMRLLVIAAATIAAASLTACNRDSSADAHLKAAGQEAKAAVQDVGKAVESTGPAIKQAGADIGQGIKKAGDEAKPGLEAAGHDVRHAADKAGDQIKEAGQKAKERVKDNGDD